MVKPHFSHSALYYIIMKKEGNTQPMLHIKVGVQSGKVYSQGMFGQCTIAKLSSSFMDRSEDSIHTHNLTCLMMEGICWTQGCTQSKDNSNNQRKIIIMTISSRLTKRGTPSRKRQRPYSLQPHHIQTIDGISSINTHYSTDHSTLLAGKC